jgi:hypothetical protein
LFDTIANFISAINLTCNCPRLLLTALANNHLDREIWQQSYLEEKQGIKSLDTYEKFTLAQYQALRGNGAPRALPTMRILMIKPDEMMELLHAKLRIVVFGNHEDCIRTKPKKYAPVLRPDTLHLIISMAVEHHCAVKQGNCKNAFCQDILPRDEITIVKPPIGDPEAPQNEYWILKHTLDGLCCSSQHWYMKIKLVLTQISLKQIAYDACLFTRNIYGQSDPVDAPSSAPLILGLYVDDFNIFQKIRK